MLTILYRKTSLCSYDPECEERGDYIIEESGIALLGKYCQQHAKIKRDFIEKLRQGNDAA